MILSGWSDSALSALMYHCAFYAILAVMSAKYATELYNDKPIGVFSMPLAVVVSSAGVILVGYSIGLLVRFFTSAPLLTVDIGITTMFAFVVYAMLLFTLIHSKKHITL